MQLKVSLSLLLFALAGLSVLSPLTSSAQSSEEKPKLKDFGSSLKRLKWDPKKQVAVDTKSTKVTGGSSMDEDVVRVDTVLAVCDVLVVDRQQDRTISGLTRSDFVITENDTPQEVSMFSNGDDVDRPRSIILVIDYSASQLPYINTSIDAAKTLVDHLAPLDRMAIVTDDVSLLVNFTRDKAKLKEKLESLKRNANSGTLGRSSQFSALFVTLRELVSNEERSIVIFQTDGDELNVLRPPFPSVVSTSNRTLRDFGFADILRAEQKARATIYSIIPGIRVIGLPELEQAKRAKTIYEKHLLALAHARPELEENMRATISCCYSRHRQRADLEMFSSASPLSYVAPVNSSSRLLSDC